MKQVSNYLERVLPYATTQARASRLHGPAHWRRVASFGAQLCRETPGADPHVVEVFAALHDTQRYTDGWDPHHGRRAAEVARNLWGTLFEATDEQLGLIVEALAYHAAGFTTRSPTIGCCWDADRLDMPRSGKAVDPMRLSTPAARGQRPRFGAAKLEGYAGS